MSTIQILPERPAKFSDEEQRDKTPLFLCPVAAGFPSPAEEYLDRKLDLHEYLVRNSAATFFVRASGDSMTQSGIMDGDLLIVDRSLIAENGSVVIAAVEGEFTVKYLAKRKGRVLLVPANDDYPEIDVTDQEDAFVWGVVTYAIHKLNSCSLSVR
jgi:DNA polymerase V